MRLSLPSTIPDSVFNPNPDLLEEIQNFENNDLILEVLQQLEAIVEEGETDYFFAPPIPLVPDKELQWYRNAYYENAIRN